jgi:predicted secreted hydrolase
MREPAAASTLSPAGWREAAAGGSPPASPLRRLSVAALALLLLQPFAPLRAADRPGADGFLLALPGYEFEFPRDHGAHDSYRTKWWYYTGHLRTDDGRRYGFEVTFSVQLDNDTELMLYIIRRTDGTPDVTSSGSLVAQDGSVIHLRAGQISVHPLKQWRSPRTGATYPMGWAVAVPSLNLAQRVTRMGGPSDLATRQPGDPSSHPL